MHHAWDVYDIHCLILKQLEPRDLARLARTSKAFFDVATDELWKTVRSFSWFIHCLPQTSRHRPRSAEDVQRLDIYARKVQSLELQGPLGLKDLLESYDWGSENQPVNWLEFWEQLWEEVYRIRPASEFLPNLRRLRFDYVDGVLALTPLHGIAGLNLDYIHLDFIWTDRKQLTEFFDGFLGTPNLKHLSVPGSNSVVTSNIIHRSPLQHLDLGLDSEFDQDGAMIKHEYSPLHDVFQKSTLEHLTLSLGPGNYWLTPEVAALDGKYLPKLKSLCLRLWHFDYEGCQEPLYDDGPHTLEPQGRRSQVLFLKGLKNPELEKLDIDFPFEITGSALLEVIRAISSSCRLQSLAELKLSGYHMMNRCDGCFSQAPSRVSPLENREALSLLLPLPSLKSLMISVASDFLDILDLDLYRDLATQLPSLEILQLGPKKWKRRPDSDVDFSCYERRPLRNLAAFCCLLPKLTDVYFVTIDGSVLEELPEGDWACPSVRVLTILFSYTETLSKDVFIHRLNRSLEVYFPKASLIFDQLKELRDN